MIDSDTLAQTRELLTEVCASGEVTDTLRGKALALIEHFDACEVNSQALIDEIHATALAYRARGVTFDPLPMVRVEREGPSVCGWVRCVINTTG